MLCHTAYGYDGWIANVANQYLQIDLLTIHMCDKLVIQGVGSRYRARTTQFKVSSVFALLIGILAERHLILLNR